MRGCRIEVQRRCVRAGAWQSGIAAPRRGERIAQRRFAIRRRRSPIELAIERGSKRCAITVRDYGPGVPEQAMQRIFDPFFRVEEARNTNGGGSGLGLSIAKRAVCVHRGSIAAENATPGLRVTISIPLTRSTAN